MSPEPATVVSAWLDAFASALVTGDLTSVFNTEDCWLRDLLVLSRDFTTVQGIANISTYLHEAAPRDRRLHNFRLDTRTNNGGVTLAANPAGLTALFRFDVDGDLAATARGCVRLVQQTDGEWRAWTVLLVLQDIVGHEENVGRAPVHVPRDGQTWDEVWEENSASITDDLAVLVVGAGHCGLMMAARLRQMGIKALVIDRAKVGDSWQNRYPSLKLHTPTFMNSFPYHSYPATWPTYLPRSKMSSFLRSYREALDLFVWESTELLSDPRPTYDDAMKRWTVHVNREGDVRILHPRHIVIAIGLNMLPRRYDVPGMADFQGVVYHSSEHHGGAAYAGKRVVVVGACNSGTDIAMDMMHKGASEVTIVQRSPTLYVSMPAVEAMAFSHLWPEYGGAAIDELDLINNSIPYALLMRILNANRGPHELDVKTVEALNNAGFKTSDGVLYELLLTRRAGYVMDQGGVAKSIIEGRIKVKHGVEVERFEKDAVVFTDGSRLQADVVVAAIGYDSMRAAASKLFGPLVDELTEVWDLDAQGELQGIYRPSGHPALWYAAGDYANGRFLGRLLALQLLLAERDASLTRG